MHRYCVYNVIAFFEALAPKSQFVAQKGFRCLKFLVGCVGMGGKGKGGDGGMVGGWAKTCLQYFYVLPIEIGVL